MSFKVEDHAFEEIKININRYCGVYLSSQLLISSSVREYVRLGKRRIFGKGFTNARFRANHGSEQAPETECY